MGEKKLLFSIRRKDFDVQHFCCGGKGGQNVNKVASGTRIVHKASGAVGESREERSQAQNTKIAFKRLTVSPAFQSWLRLEAGAKMLGFQGIEDKVEKMVEEANLKIEVFEDGEWVVEGVKDRGTQRDRSGN